MGAFEQEDVTTPLIAWLILAAVLAVVGAFALWFHGKAHTAGTGMTSFGFPQLGYLTIAAAGIRTTTGVRTASGIRAARARATTR